jgi:tetratricopeptide (TPR) repeat protein/transcriptional regulator with XRE-family HTH domain
MDLSTRQGRREQGQRIQRAVERAGLSIEELAGRIGCSRALIYQYLSGTTLAQPDRLQQIAAECGVSLAYFYVDEADEERQTTATASLPPSVVPPSPLQEVTARLADGLRALQELADAQENPPDYRALAATCERVLSLAAQLGDRVAQTRAQERLGNALLMTGDNLRAADALSRAIALSVETGETRTENIARQSLGKALWSLGRVPEAREQFELTANGPVYGGRWRGLLSLGSIDEQYGEYQEAMQRFDEAAVILEEGAAAGQLSAQEISVGLLYVNTNRRNVYLAGGDFAEARQLAEKCMADAEAQGNAAQHLSARFDLAWSDFCIGRWATAYHGLSTTLQLARFISDQGRENIVRAWLGIFLAAAGDHDTAIAYGKDALALALSRGDRQAELYAQLALADAYTGAGNRSVEARYHTNQALAVTTSVRYARAEIECRLRLARLCAQDGQWPELYEAAQRAAVLAQRLGARHLECLARCWLAEAMRHSALAPSNTGGDAAMRRAGGTPVPISTQAVRQELEAALALARDTEFIEAQWRGHDTLAGLALAGGALDSQAADQQLAETHLLAAVAVLEPLRSALIEAGLPDTLLENPDCHGVYERLARLLFQLGRAEEAVAFLDQTGWPPLTERITREFDAMAREA